MKLYSYRGSANAYKVELVLAQLERGYERVEVDIFSGGSRTPEFLRRNPVGRVPVLELEDGHAIAESNAILWHLAQGTKLLPASPRAQTQVLSWLFFEQSEVEPVLGSARFWVLTGRARGRDDELARRLAWGRRSLAVLEQHLAAHAYLVDEQYSIGDVALYAYVHLADDAGVALADYPAIRAWCQRLERLPRFVAGPGPYSADAMVSH